MKKTAPRIFLFDIGNVMVRTDYGITYRILESLGVPPAHAERFFENDDRLEFNRGNIDGRGFYDALIKKYLQHELPYEEIVSAHDRHMYELDYDMVRILDALRAAGQTVAFATDTNDWQMRREHELLDVKRFDGPVFRSNEWHMIKIDPGFFPRVLKELGAPPSEILFVDDSIYKIESAERSGIQTFHFERNPDELAWRIKERGTDLRVQF